MESRDVDVAVVGAGLSGLSAAHRLLQTDPSLRILVLEAKDRIGGRTLTAQLKSADGLVDFWDLGGEWVGRPQPQLQDLLKLFQLDTFNPVIPQGVPESLSLSIWAKLDLYFFTRKLFYLKRKFHTCDINNSVEAVAYDGMTLEHYRDKSLWTKGAKDVVDAACRCMFGLACSEMTLLYFLMNIGSAGGLDVFTKPIEYAGKESRVKGGLQQLSMHLSQAIGMQNILLGYPVTHIVQTDSDVTLVTSKRLQVRCERVIIAIPPHHAAALNFTPALPSNKLNLLRSIPLAYIVKFIFSYNQAFWLGDKHGIDKNKFGFQTVLCDGDKGPVGIVYDGTSARGNPALIGFLTTPHIGDQEFNESQGQDTVLPLLQEVLGDKVWNYSDCGFKDWRKEPYNGGCFLKSIMPGTTRYFNSLLRDPLGRVNFAGTESATVWCGFMNGAVQAGIRAATEVLHNLRPGLTLTADSEEDGMNFTPSRTSLILSSFIGLTALALLALVSKRTRFYIIPESFTLNLLPVSNGSPNI